MNRAGELLLQNVMNHTLTLDTTFPFKPGGYDSQFEMTFPGAVMARMTKMFVTFVDKLEKLWLKSRFQLCFYLIGYRHTL